jgi:bifunctional UDP-N-acetylglucosamine pyrophosphorylase/glucosamine-1-phosphate N-acetyltransferase
MDNLAVAILAAGQGTRMKSKLPKVLHPVAGLPIICHVLNSARAVTSRKPVLVIGHGADAVREMLGEQVEYSYQAQRLGTGHALLQARPALESSSETVLSLYGDMPLLTAETLQQLIATHAEHQPAITMLTVLSDDSMGFGRVIRDEKGEVQRVVEEVDCTPEQRRIKELNCGIYCFRASWLWPRLPNIQLSRKGEYYLTDMVEMAVREGQPVKAVTLDDVREVIGINDRTQLAWAESVLRDRVRVSWMRAGVTIIDPQTTYIDASVKIGCDTVIHPNTHLQGATVVSEDCIIGPNSILRDTRIGRNCRVVYSVVEEAVLEEGVDVGPFAHLRPGAHLGRGVHMGNFGEIKNSHVGAGTIISHFSYLGEATVGERVNIGAGTVTCNFDGQRKNATVIEDGAFVGSGTMIVAPVRIGAGARVGAGSVVTHDVPANALVYGVPARVKKEDAG